MYIFKKALFLIHAIRIRFRDSPGSVPIPDTTRLPVFADNVLPSLLVYLGVLDISRASQGISDVFSQFAAKGSHDLLAASESNECTPTTRLGTPSEGPVLNTVQASILRAAAVDACEVIAERARSLDPPADWIKNLTLPNLDMWLWSIAKDRSDYRKLPRFVLKETVMF